MRQPREILREYRERKQAEAPAGSTESLREENLRRLLRHAGAAHQPSPWFEERLLQAMLRTRAESAARRARRGWRRRPLAAWPLWAPAAALAASALAVATQFHLARPSQPLAHLPSKPPLPAPPIDHRAPVLRRSPPIGLVIMGELRRRHEGEKEWEAAGSDASVYPGDEVRTGAETSASIVFLDSSVCRLLPNTTLRYGGAARRGRTRPDLLLLTRGETWNTVEKGGPPFVVRTRSATATVWGTEFGVAVDRKGRTTLRVKEGKVELQAGRSAVMVTAGMESAVLPGHAPEPPISMKPPAPRHRKPGPGAIHTAPGGENARPGASDQSDQTFHRSPPAAPAPATTDLSSPGAPADSSGAPGTSDGDTQPRVPISTSR